MAWEAPTFLGLGSQSILFVDVTGVTTPTATSQLTRECISQQLKTVEYKPTSRPVFLIFNVTLVYHDFKESGV